MNLPLSQEFALDFAHEWVEAWNSHDLERVLQHYARDVELTSPFVRHILGTEATMVRGITALRDYFSRPLTLRPDLRFVPKHVYCGIRSIVVQYESVGSSLSWWAQPD